MSEHVLVWWLDSAFHTEQINCWCMLGVCCGDANIAWLSSLWQVRYRVRNNYRPCVKVLRYHTTPQLPTRNDVWHFRSPRIRLVPLLELLRYSPVWSTSGNGGCNSVNSNEIDVKQYFVLILIWTLFCSSYNSCFSKKFCLKNCFRIWTILSVSI